MIIRFHATCFSFGQRGVQGSEWKIKQTNGSERPTVTIPWVITGTIQWCWSMWFGETPESDKKEILGNWHSADCNKCFTGNKILKGDECREEIRKTLSKGAWQEIWLLYWIERDIAGYEKQPCDADRVGFFITTLHIRKLWPIGFEDLPTGYLSCRI